MLSGGVPRLQRLEDEEQAQACYEAGRGDGQPRQQAPVEAHPAQFRASVYDRQADNCQHRGEPQAEGDYQREAKPHAIEVHRAQQHEKGRGARYDAACDAQQEQVLHRGLLPVGREVGVRAAERPVFVGRRWNAGTLERWNVFVCVIVFVIVGVPVVMGVVVVVGMDVVVLLVIVVVGVVVARACYCRGQGACALHGPVALDEEDRANSRDQEAGEEIEIGVDRFRGDVGRQEEHYDAQDEDAIVWRTVTVRPSMTACQGVPRLPTRYAATTVLPCPGESACPAPKTKESTSASRKKPIVRFFSPISAAKGSLRCGVPADAVVTPVWVLQSLAAVLEASKLRVAEDTSGGFCRRSGL